MAIMCPRVPLPARASILNVDLDEMDIVPPILIEKCTLEIERRYISRNGIYRMSGVASRVEKLLKSFESGPHLIDLSDVGANDLASVLKVFLRQVWFISILFIFVLITCIAHCCIAFQTSLPIDIFYIRIWIDQIWWWIIWFCSIMPIMIYHFFFPSIQSHSFHRTSIFLNFNSSK